MNGSLGSGQDQSSDTRDSGCVGTDEGHVDLRPTKAGPSL